MPFIQWNESLSVGIEYFDDQHKRLIAIINELHDAMRQGKGKQVLGKTLDELESYTVRHFSDEEKAFKGHLYPDAERHALQHKELVARVADMRKRAMEGDLLLSIPLMEMLKDWLAKHILGTDKQYGPFLKSKGWEPD